MYPTTYNDVFEQIVTWIDNYSADSPEYTLSDIQQNGLAILIEMIIKEYIFQKEMNSEYLTFNAQDFREVITSVLLHAELFSDEYEQWGMPLLSSYNQGFGVSYNDGNRVKMILPPTIAENGKQYLFTELELIAIHEKSTNKEEAQKFILWYSRHLADTIQYKMSPCLNSPIENPNYAIRLLEINNNLIELKDARNRAMDMVDAGKLDELISKKERQMAALSSIQWTISQESIDCYREIATRIKIPDDSVFFNSSGFNSIREVVTRFCDNGFDTTQMNAFISELERVVYMVMMENQ